MAENGKRTPTALERAEAAVVQERAMLTRERRRANEAEAEVEQERKWSRQADEREGRYREVLLDAWRLLFKGGAVREVAGDIEKALRDNHPLGELGPVENLRRGSDA